MNANGERVAPPEAPAKAKAPASSQDAFDNLENADELREMGITSLAELAAFVANGGTSDNPPAPDDNPPGGEDDQETTFSNIPNHEKLEAFGITKLAEFDAFVGDLSGTELIAKLQTIDGIGPKMSEEIAAWHEGE